METQGVRGRHRRQGIAAGILLSAFSLCIAASPSHAYLQNPGFEASPPLANWDTFETNVTQVDSSFGVNVPEGTYQALISTEEGAPGASPKTAGDIEGFLGLNSGDLDALSTNFTVEGSVITQTFWGDHGTQINFLWNFLTNENSGDPFYNDLAFYSLQTPSSGPTVALLADTLSPLIGSSSPFALQTGYNHLSISLLGGTGLYTIGFGVLHVGDDQIHSALAVDAVPEPSSLALLASGLAGLGYWRRKQVLAAQSV